MSPCGRTTVDLGSQLLDITMSSHVYRDALLRPPDSYCGSICSTPLAPPRCDGFAIRWRLRTLANKWLPVADLRLLQSTFPSVRVNAMKEADAH